MKYFIIILLTLNSCGIINAHFGKHIYYSENVLRQYDSENWFFRFNHKPIDSVMMQINELGKIKYRIIVNRNGEVLHARVLKSSLSKEAERKISLTVEDLEFIPYLNSELAVTDITFKRKENWAPLLMAPLKPLKKSKAEKYFLNKTL